MRYSLYDAATDFAKACAVGAVFGSALIYGATKAMAATSWADVAHSGFRYGAPIIIACLLLYILICALCPDVEDDTGFDDEAKDRPRRTVEDDARAGQ